MITHYEELNIFYRSFSDHDLIESELATIKLLENSATAFRCKISNELPTQYLTNALIWHDIFVIAYSYNYTVNSGYRCPELNKKVGGAPGSLHQKALAVDFNIGCNPDKLIFDRFLGDVNRLLSPKSLRIGYHYKRNNMLHVELEFIN